MNEWTMVSQGTRMVVHVLYFWRMLGLFILLKSVFAVCKARMTALCKRDWQSEPNRMFQVHPFKFSSLHCLTV